MKRLLNTLLILVAVGLCVVCVVQWVREDRLRTHITDLVKRLEAENALRIDAERKAAEYAKEIERLTALRAEVEAKLLVVTDELNAMSTDSVARGITLAHFVVQHLEMEAKLTAYESAVGQSSTALKEHNTAVTAQNETIAKQNELLKKLVTERDSAVEKLNARTREFNDLVEKYNKLAKSR